LIPFYIEGEPMTFDSLHIIKPILESLALEGYTIPTPIQLEAIPPLLEGRDLLGSAQTGTGKTAAFAIPILQKLYSKSMPTKKEKRIKALILTPTRELAAQIQDSFRTYGRNLGLKTIVVFGGVGQKPQTDMLKAGVDILVATPGRLLDLMAQGFIDLQFLDFFVLDEADRMLDMGFIHDVNKVIAKLPSIRQTMLFSATMPPLIEELANSILVRPKRIAITPVETTVEKIEQFVYHVAKKNKVELLYALLKDKKISSALVFTRTKHMANKVSQALFTKGVTTDAIHGNKSQSARIEALRRFKAGEIRVLVATDIAARGLDIDELSHVINFDLPDVPETYIHRIGRTGRAGLSGVAITFCGEDEYGLFLDIEFHIGIKINVIKDHLFAITPTLQKPMPKPPVMPKRRRNPYERTSR
jgi:ATP-dependent RNA helicase RhlE